MPPNIPPAITALLISLRDGPDNEPEVDIDEVGVDIISVAVMERLGVAEAVVEAEVGVETEMGVCEFADVISLVEISVEVLPVEGDEEEAPTSIGLLSAILSWSSLTTSKVKSPWLGNTTETVPISWSEFTEAANPAGSTPFERKWISNFSGSPCSRAQVTFTGVLTSTVGLTSSVTMARVEERKERSMMHKTRIVRSKKP